MVKIAIITETFPPQGASGVSTAHFNLFRLLKENQFKVKVFTFNDNPEYYNSIPADPDVYHFGISLKLRHRIRALVEKAYKYQRKLFYKTDTYLTAYQVIDIIIANRGSRKINKELKKFNPAFVVIPDHGVPGYAIKKINGACYVHVSHHNPIRFINNAFFGYQSEYDARIALRIEKQALTKVERVICPSQYMKEVFINTFGNKLPVTVLPNLMDHRFIESIEAVSVQEKLSQSSDFPIVYIPSGGSSFKGERFVVEIIRRLSVIYNFNLGFYISGGLSVIQEEELELLKVYSKLIFSPGVVENKVNIGYIKSCSVCVSPTIVENFSMAILEANFCNVPVVTFDVGGNKEIIEDGQNGYIVPFMDIEFMMLKTCELLDNNTRLITQKFVNDKFSTKALNEKYLEFFTTTV